MSGAATLRLVVAGAHMSGLRLNHQLTDLGARLSRATKTAPVYREGPAAGAGPAGPFARVAVDLRSVSTTRSAPLARPWKGPVDTVHCVAIGPMESSAHRSCPRFPDRLHPGRASLPGMYSLGGLRPALIRQPEASSEGLAFEVEVWEVPLEAVG
jgi:hypothetical protein